MGKAKRSKQGQYAPLPYPMLKSEAWRGLSNNAVRVFLELHTRYNGSNNGKLVLSYAEAAKALGIGKAGVQRAYKQLTDRGLLALEAKGDWYGRKAHEWRLTYKPVQKAKGVSPPTNEWRCFLTVKTEGGSKSEP